MWSVRHIKKCIVLICILSVGLFGKVCDVILLYYVEYHVMADLPRSTLTLQYSRHQLLEYRQHYCFPTFTTLFILKQCGIFKFRGRRGGRNRRIQRYANSSFPFCSRPLSCRGVNLHNFNLCWKEKGLSCCSRIFIFTSGVMFSKCSLS